MFTIYLYKPSGHRKSVALTLLPTIRILSVTIMLRKRAGLQGSSSGLLGLIANRGGSFAKLLSFDLTHGQSEMLASVVHLIDKAEEEEGTAACVGVQEVRLQRATR